MMKNNSSYVVIKVFPELWALITLLQLTYVKVYGRGIKIICSDRSSFGLVFDNG